MNPIPPLPKVSSIPIQLSIVEPNRRQIVTPPENALEVKENKTAKYLSDKNLQTEKEQIKKGSGKKTEIPVRSKAAQPSSPEKPEQKRIKTLKLKEDLVQSKFGLKPSEIEKLKENPNKVQQEFSRPEGSGAAFLGLGGVPDFLPDLPDGDITFLNTKASQFAVFVRRVATRVFGQMRQTGWDYLRAEDIRSIKDFARVRTILDPNGKVLSVSLIQSSGNRKFDDVLVNAARIAAADKNPPQEAALSDGNYHFIFQSRSWVRGVIGRSGNPTERRWLLLSTGLE